MSVGPGDTVTFDFTLNLADGTPVDASGEEPATIVIGQGELFECLEQRLLGLSPGDQRHFEIPAAETLAAFPGTAVERLPRDRFPADMEIEPGMVLGFEMPDGEEIAGTVADVCDDEVVVDFTHPLAGRELVFEVSIRSVASHGRTETAGS